MKELLRSARQFFEIVAFRNLADDVVSLATTLIPIALLNVAYQVLQQYFSTSGGLRECGEDVIGQWSDENELRLTGRILDSKRSSQRRIFS
jgi:hypothetical protein